jgi:hypothetical protein
MLLCSVEEHMNSQMYSFSCFHMHSHDHVKLVVPKVCPTDPKKYVDTFLYRVLWTFWDFVRNDCKLLELAICLLYTNVRISNALLCMLLISICRYLKSFMRYKFLVLDIYHPETLHLHQPGCEDMWLVFKAKTGL